MWVMPMLLIYMMNLDTVNLHLLQLRGICGKLTVKEILSISLLSEIKRVDIQTQRSPDPLAGSRPELVPTLGAPGSDLVAVEGFDGRDHVSAFPVGRLSITQPIHVMNYLNKVIDKERTIKNSPWSKNFVQLSGGLSTSELVRFTTIIDNLKEIAEDVI